MDRKQCLDAAAKCVLTDRASSYGAPEESFELTAMMWSIILAHRVSASDVALCMAALKMVRLIKTRDHADSWVDLAGYAACGAEVACE